MYSIHNWDDLEKLKNLYEIRSSLRQGRLKEKPGKQNFHYDMEEVFVPVTAKQAEATENQKQNQFQIQQQAEKQVPPIENMSRNLSQNNQ